MWVYQNTVENTTGSGTASADVKESLHFSEENTLPQRVPRCAAVPEAVEAAKSAGKRAAVPLSAPPAHRTSHSDAHRRAKADTDLFLLAGLYGFGACLAGVLRALGGAEEHVFVQYCFAEWQALCLAGQPLRLFLAQYGGAVLSLTLMLVLGLCAFGTPLLHLLVLLYGVGTGVLCIEQFLTGAWRSLALSVPLSALPAAVLACCLCLFGAQAAKLSLRLGRSAFTKKEPEAVAFSARMLLARYLFFCVVMALFCGFAAACSGLAAALFGA